MICYMSYIYLIFMLFIYIYINKLGIGVEIPKLMYNYYKFVCYYNPSKIKLNPSSFN